MITTAKTFHGWVCFVLAGVCLAGCDEKKVGSERTKASTEFEPNRSLFAAIGKADRLILYEGLPHQNDEQELLEKEKRNKPTVTLHGFPFYRPALDVASDDVEKLRGLLGAEGSFVPWRGEKKCGGFHPDYLAEWRVGDGVYRVLICLGCHEVKVFGPDSSLRCDIHQDKAFGELRDLLKKYRKNRPASKEP
jgi:hypothetical protein